MISEEYRQLVLEDLRKYEGIWRPVRASLLERLLRRKAPAEKLHPNPDDEFSKPEVGPNYEIVGRYADTIRRARGRSYEPIEERLMVQKMSTGGYMILNGHHRWMAARRMGLPKLPVRVINATDDQKILLELGNSDKKMCVSFDLDEVLLTDGERCEKDRELCFPLNRIVTKTLRKNAGILMNELTKAGFDVWVYTGCWYSEDDIRALLRLGRTAAYGIVNGAGRRKTGKIREAFREKYTVSLHIDNESIIAVNTETGEHRTADLSGNPETWAADAMKAIKELNPDGS